MISYISIIEVKPVSLIFFEILGKNLLGDLERSKAIFVKLALMMTRYHK